MGSECPYIEVHLVALPCFYSSLKWTILVLDCTFGHFYVTIVLQNAFKTEITPAAA